MCRNIAVGACVTPQFISSGAVRCSRCALPPRARRPPPTGKSRRAWRPAIATATTITSTRRATEIDVSGGEADAAVTFRTLDPRTQFEITPRMQRHLFPGRARRGLDRLLPDAAVRDVTPRRRIGVRGRVLARRRGAQRAAGAAMSTAAISAIPVDGDSGRFVERNTRDYCSHRAVLQLRRDAALPHRVRGALPATPTSTSSSRARSRTSARSGVSAGWGFLYSRALRSDRCARLASQYETTFDTDAYGGDVQWDTNFTEHSRMYVRARRAADRTGERRERHQRDRAASAASWNSQRNTLFAGLHAHRRAHVRGNCSGASSVAYADSTTTCRRASALLLGARASRDEDIDDSRHYPDAQVRGGRGRASNGACCATSR